MDSEPWLKASQPPKEKNTRSLGHGPSCLSTQQEKACRPQAHGPRPTATRPHGKMRGDKSPKPGWLDGGEERGEGGAGGIYKAPGPLPARASCIKQKLIVIYLPADLAPKAGEEPSSSLGRTAAQAMDRPGFSRRFDLLNLH